MRANRKKRKLLGLCAAEAAGGGHLDVLEWSLEEGMPLAKARSIDGQALVAAVRSGGVEVVEWCVLHRFSVDEAVDRATLSWARRNPQAFPPPFCRIYFDEYSSRSG